MFLADFTIMPCGVLDAVATRLVGDGGGEDGGDLVVGEVEAGARGGLV